MYVLEICHLYPDILNLYGDRGNVLCMAQRLRAGQPFALADEKKRRGSHACQRRMARQQQAYTQKRPQGQQCAAEKRIPQGRKRGGEGFSHR